MGLVQWVDRDRHQIRSLAELTRLQCNQDQTKLKIIFSSFLPFFGKKIYQTMH